MRILITSDWHIKATHLGRECRLEDFYIFEKKWLELVDEVKPDLVVNLGDVFHTLSPYIRKDVLMVGSEIFQETAKRCRVVVLAGNHDMFRGEVAIKFLENVNIRIIDQAYEGREGDIRMTFVPYGWESSLDRLHETDLLFLHTDVKGVKLSSGKIMEEGIEPFLNVGKFVFNGHIHRPQRVGNIECVGSVMQHDFSESGERKRVILWEDGKVRDIFIEGLPSFHIVEVHSAKSLSRLLYPKFCYLLVRAKPGLDLSQLEDNPRIFVEFLPEEKEAEKAEEVEDKPLSVVEEIERWIDELELENELKIKMKKLALEVWECSR